MNRSVQQAADAAGSGSRNDTAAASSVPLTLLTGFLGAGKTSVLNRILAGDHGLRVAVLVNDFGDLDIAEELVAGRTDGTLRLTNGCICCSLKEDLVGSVMELLHRDPRPDHIVLEASGVADPTGIATTLLAPVFAGRTRLDGVICVVDAAGLDARHAEHDLILRQLMVSDLVLLNKVDTLDPARRAAAEALIRGWLSQARVLPATHGDAPLDVLLSSLRAPGAEAAGCGDDHAPCTAGDCDHPAHRPHARFDTWYFSTGVPLCAEALRDTVRALPGSVYRIKGRALLADPPGATAVIQGVGRRLDLEPLPADHGRPPGTHLLVIGAAGSLDAAALQAAFEACRRPTVAAGAPGDSAARR